MSTVPFERQSIIEQELHQGERVLWSSSPGTMRFVRKGLPLVLFGIPWTAFAIFWIAGASGFKAPDFRHGAGLFPLFGIPFVLVGLSMLSSPFWFARKATKTVYAITTERVIVFEAGLFGSMTVQSFLPHQLLATRRIQYSDGSGDLILDSRLEPARNGARRTTDIGFFGVADIRRVEALVTKLAGAGTGA